VEIRGVNAQSGPGRVSGNSSVKPSQPSQVTATGSDGDQVQISAAGRYLDRYSNLPQIRADKVAGARESLAAGTMDTDEKLSVAIDRLLDDLLGQ